MSNVDLQLPAHRFRIAPSEAPEEALLKKMDGSPYGEVEPKALIVQGELTLKRPDGARSATQGGGGSATMEEQ